MTHDPDTTPNTAEGTRSATRFLELVADGQCAADLSAALHRLALKLRTECKHRQDKVAGELALKLKLTAEPTGVVAVSYEVSSKDPKSRTSGSVFWLTRGGNLTVDNPRQAVLPGIREVKRPDDVPARDVVANE